MSNDRNNYRFVYICWTKVFPSMIILSGPIANGSEVWDFEFGYWCLEFI